MIIHKILSLQYNRHSFNILSYPGDLLCFILDVPCAISENSEWLLLLFNIMCNIVIWVGVIYLCVVLHVVLIIF